MIQIRALQHYLYCPHRWGMRYLDDVWEDNAFTVLAGQVHERVHSEKFLRQTDKITSFGDLSVYSNEIGIYGKADCVEFVKDPRGVSVSGLRDKYVINVVEYKPTQPQSASPADRVQLYAQYRCVSDIFGGNVKAFLYYNDVRRRMRIDFNDEDEKLLLQLVDEINKATDSHIVPPPEYGKKCSGCSLADRCMPRVRTDRVKSMILEGE